MYVVNLTSKSFFNNAIHLYSSIVCEECSPNDMKQRDYLVVRVHIFKFLICGMNPETLIIVY